MLGRALGQEVGGCRRECMVERCQTAQRALLLGQSGDNAWPHSAWTVTMYMYEQWCAEGTCRFCVEMML